MTRAETVEKQVPQLKSSAFRAWLENPIYNIGGVRYSRHDIQTITDTPCTRAAGQLDRACRQYGIKSLDQLHGIGLAALLRCRGVGERTAWVAAMILYLEGYSLRSWVKSKDAGSLRNAIRLVHDRTRKQKHG